MSERTNNTILFFLFYFLLLEKLEIFEFVIPIAHFFFVFGFENISRNEFYVEHGIFEEHYFKEQLFFITSVKCFVYRNSLTIERHKPLIEQIVAKLVANNQMSDCAEGLIVHLRMLSFESEWETSASDFRMECRNRSKSRKL